MWELLPICILQEKHIYRLFFLLFECIPFNTQSFICTTIQRNKMWTFKAYALICNAYYYFMVFKCLQFPLFISHNFLTRTCLLDKKQTLVLLHKLCIWSWIIYLSQRGHSLLSHYFFTYTLKKLTYHQHQKLTNFIGLSKICTKFVISWVCVVENILSYLYMF
jgi:hypothetical protein